jgi:hypothetical protein
MIIKGVIGVWARGSAGRIGDWALGLPEGKERIPDSKFKIRGSASQFRDTHHGAWEIQDAKGN